MRLFWKYLLLGGFGAWSASLSGEDRHVIIVTVTQVTIGKWVQLLLDGLSDPLVSLSPPEDGVLVIPTLTAGVTHAITGASTLDRGGSKPLSLCKRKGLGLGGRKHPRAESQDLVHL